MALNQNNSDLIDPHKSKEKFLNWFNSGKELGLPEQEKIIFLQYLEDMRIGSNVNHIRKGGRSFKRLNSVRTRVPQLFRLYSKKFNKSILETTRKEVTELFNELETGIIAKNDGNKYKSVSDFAKDFKAFWHWHMRIEAEKDNTIKDITVDLNSAPGKKPKFVYITMDDLKKLLNNAKFEYRALMLFLFDSGIRAPTELANIKVKDIMPEKKDDWSIIQLNIPDEVSKTFGRKIKLMLCGQTLKEYIEHFGLQRDDFLFKVNPVVVNKYIKRLAYNVLKIGKLSKSEFMSKNGRKLVNYNVSDSLNLYDFRHASACYWVARYKSIPGLMYRFGWKNPEMIEYYSNFLGMTDKITEDDLIDTEMKSRLEKELEQQKQKNSLMGEQLESMQKKMQDFSKQTDTWKNNIRKELMEEALQLMKNEIIKK